jgi:ribosomal protein S18 acetylase RimI-like enzyme
MDESPSPVPRSGVHQRATHAGLASVAPLQPVIELAAPAPSAPGSPLPSISSSLSSTSSNPSSLLTPALDAVEVRRPRYEDRAAIKAVHDALLEVQYDDTFFEALFTEPSAICFCAYASDGSVVGSATARMSPFPLSSFLGGGDSEGPLWPPWPSKVVERIRMWATGAQVGYIMTMGVLPRYRRRGLARLLLDSICDALEREGCACAALHCLASNDAAVALYTNAGFRRSVQLKAHYYFHGRFHDALLLKRTFVQGTGGGDAPAPAAHDFYYMPAPARNLCSWLLHSAGAATWLPGGVLAFVRRVVSGRPQRSLGWQRRKGGTGREGEGYASGSGDEERDVEGGDGDDATI